VNGKFIVLEGIDGAGTTTQLALLAARLRAHGERVHTTREPSDGPVGNMLRQFLSGRMSGKLTHADAGPHARTAPCWQTMALLFAADRCDHIECEVTPALAAGSYVLSDRYDASSLAYQSVSASDDEDTLRWIRTLNRYARRPDLTIVLDVPDAVAEARRTARGESEQLYDKAETQRKLAAFYRKLPEFLPGDAIVVLSGDGSIDTIEGRVWAAVQTATPNS
jgi:dTMP kinase